MKAVIIHAFGGPEVLQLEDTARPVPAPDKILVQVYASGVNPVPTGSCGKAATTFCGPC